MITEFSGAALNTTSKLEIPTKNNRNIAKKRRRMNLQVLFKTFEVDRLCGCVVVAVEFDVETGRFAHQIVITPGGIRHVHVLVAVSGKKIEAYFKRTRAGYRLNTK